MLRERVQPVAGPVRVLLVARPAGSWWHGLRHELAKAGMASSATGLGPLAPTIAGRAAIYGAACATFADRLGVTDVTEWPVPDLAGDRWKLVLTIHMAALAAVDAHVRETTAPIEPDLISAYLLDREHAHWQALHGNGRIGTAQAMIGRAAYTATLTGPMPRARAVEVLTAVQVEPSNSVVDDHAMCYPPDDPAAALQPIYPDLLGEDFLALSTPGHPVADYLPDGWATTAAAKLLSGVDADEPSPWAASAVTVLVETARRWPHIATGVLGPLLRANPGLALTAGNAAMTGLAAIEDIGMEVLDLIAARFPARRHLDLDVGIAAITSRLTGPRLRAAVDDHTRASLHDEAGQRLGNAGRYAEGADALAAAADLYRHMGDEYASELAGALSSLSYLYSKLGRQSEAIAATTEAVGTLRRLVRTDVSHLPDLANALQSLGVDLSHQGRLAESLDATVEGVRYLRLIAEADPERSKVDLARALANLGIRLSHAGERKEALVVGREAVGLFREAVARDPTRHQDELALALDELGSRLTDVGRREQAVEASQEAVVLHRRLAAVNPAAFGPDLAQSLGRLGIRLSFVGRWSEGLAVTAEAVGTWRLLAAMAPLAYEPQLAEALSLYGVRAAEVGRVADALRATADAAHVLRRLASDNPRAYQPNLAATLDNLGVRLFEAGRRTEARQVTAESVQLYRDLAAADPRTYEPDLAMALANLGAFASSLGEPEAAVEAAAEAVQIRGRLAAANPDAFLPDLAMSLVNLGIGLAKTHRCSDGLVVTADAVQMCRQLSANVPDAFRFDLARALRGFAAVRLWCGRELPEASAAADESQALLRSLADEYPDKFTAELASLDDIRIGLQAASTNSSGDNPDGVLPSAASEPVAGDGQDATP
ncbi:tetratricopeptide repeat protein [Micromonospora sp. NPDC005806]|uniref:tetratricopeptide repeat protein n=1 Tax=Micromonospora sp. NPDC005806 TaxID=3364234 RepID=UPI0036A197C2